MGSEHAWKALQQVNEWIRFADAKAAAVLAASGILGGLVAKSAPTSINFSSQPLVALLTVSALAFVGGAVALSLCVFAPALNTGEPRSLLYFDHVARQYSQSPRRFSEHLATLLSHESDYTKQVAQQVWANSVIARKKFRRVALAVYALGIAMACSGLALVVEGLQKAG